MDKFYTDFSKLAYLKGVIDTIITASKEGDDTAKSIAKLLINAMETINKE